MTDFHPPARADYDTTGLDLGDLAADPLVQFGRWFDAAVTAHVVQADAMILATVGDGGRPAARTVLLRGLDERGLVFFTNYTSAKGRHLDANPRAAAVFLWREQHRQVRVEGAVERVSADVSDAYWATRPGGARVAAAASPQSEAVPDRATLERWFDGLAGDFPDGNVPRPPHWGGYRLVPDTWEFWQGRRHRLHDRFRYRMERGAWLIDRLAP